MLLPLVICNFGLCFVHEAFSTWILSCNISLILVKIWKEDSLNVPPRNIMQFCKQWRRYTRRAELQISALIFMTKLLSSYWCTKINLEVKHMEFTFLWTGFRTWCYAVKCATKSGNNTQWNLDTKLTFWRLFLVSVLLRASISNWYQ